MTQKPSQLRPIVSYPPETVLTKEQLAAALNCSVATLEKADLPVFYVASLPRYSWRQVLAFLEGRAA